MDGKMYRLSNLQNCYKRVFDWVGLGFRAKAHVRILRMHSSYDIINHTFQYGLGALIDVIDTGHLE